LKNMESMTVRNEGGCNSVKDVLPEVREEVEIPQSEMAKTKRSIGMSGETSPLQIIMERQLWLWKLDDGKKSGCLLESLPIY